MKQKKKKAFTIVELVIVIAVIAILAAVLIPTFSNIIDKANDSSALQNGRNMYMEYISTEDNYSKANENFVIEVKENEAYVTFKDGKIVDEVFSTKEAAINSLGAGASYIFVNEELLGTEGVTCEHEEEIIPAVPATCEEAGLTEGKICSVCGKTLVAQTEIPAKGHSYTDGKCTVCQKDDPGHVHTEEVIPGRDATCTEKGLTEGKKCSVCGETLLAQEEIPSGHNYVDGKCNVCNELKPSEGLVFTLNSDKISYSVTEIGTCADTDVVIPSTYNGLPITNIDTQAFSSCEDIESIKIPNSVTSIGNNAFSWCEKLQSIEIPNSVISIGGHAFYDCTSLTSITIPSSVISIGEDAFSGCTNLTSIVVDSNNTIYDSRGNCNAIIETATNGLIVGTKNTIIPETVVSIGDNAFSFCEKLQSIEIPNSVISIGEWAFSDCTSLKEVIFEENSQLTTIGRYAFSDCTSLTSIEIPNSVTSIVNNTFEGCTNLTSIEIPNSVTSIGEYAFSDCTSLTSIEIPNSVTSIDAHAFSDCTSLQSLIIPNSVTSIGIYAFEYCTSLSIYCEVSAKPAGWNYNWTYKIRSIYWSADWYYNEGIPTPRNN